MPLSVETEPLVETAKEEYVAELDAAANDVDSQEDSQDAGPITPEELRDGATAAVEDAAGDVTESEPVTPQVDYDDQPATIKEGDQVDLGDGTMVTVLSDANPPEKPIAILPPPPSASATLAKISEAAEEVREWREKLALLKDEAKEAKENLQGAINRLMRLSSEVANDSKRPLLAAAENTVENGKAVAAGADSPTNQEAAGGDSDATAASAASNADDPDAWRAIRLDDPNYFPSLAGQKGLLTKLAENDIETIGQMVDFQSAKNGSKDITDIKGVGSGKAEKIGDALETFWREHPEMNFDAAVEAS